MAGQTNNTGDVVVPPPIVPLPVAIVGQAIVGACVVGESSTVPGTTDPPPATPTGLALTGTTSSTASFSWDAITDEAVDYVRLTATGAGRTATVTIAAAETTGTVTGLYTETAYSVTIAAHNAAGWGTASAPVTATTDAGGDPPPAIAGFTHPLCTWIVDKTATSVTVACSHTSEDAATYKVYRDGVLMASDLTPTDGEVVYIDSDLTPNATHVWHFRAVKSDGTQSADGWTVTAKVKAPVVVSNRAEYQAAMGQSGASVALPGDFVRFGANIDFATDNVYVAPGAVVDLNGYTATFAKVSTTSRGFFWYDMGPARVMNGTIAGNVDYALVSLKSGESDWFRDLDITGIKTGIKLDTQDAPTSGEHRGVYVSRVRFVGRAGEAGYFLNFGGTQSSGKLRDVVVRDASGTLSATGNLTSLDNIAFEESIGTTVMERVLVDGSVGDGIDVKNWGALYYTDIECTNITRNGVKTWGMAGYPQVWKRIHQSNCGYNAMLNAGIAAVTDSYFEGGTLDGSAMYFGSTQSGTGPGYGGVSATVTNTVFRRVSGVGLLVCVPTNAGVVNTSDFTNCAFYNPGHPSVCTTYGGADNGDIQSVANAQAGVWNTRYHACRYAEETAPVAINPPAAPVFTTV